MTLVERLRTAGCVYAEDEAALLTAAFSGAELESAAARRITGEPLEWILGSVSFAGRSFALSPGVFIPRQRSQGLVSLAISLAPPAPLIVDLCCGCGALGLSVLASTGGSLVSSDIDDRAVSDAVRNGAFAVVGSLFSALPASLRASVDVLVCNAPYVPSAAVPLMPRDSREHEEAHLVDGGADGLDVQRQLLSSAANWLSPRGVLLTETTPEQAGELVAHAAASRLVASLHSDSSYDVSVLVAALA